MNIIIIILAVLITPFVIVFILGYVKASNVGSDKKRRARAIVSLSQMTEEQITALKDIFIAYKTNDIKKANRISENTSSEIRSFLIGFFDINNRPIEYSSGSAGKITWIAFENELKKLGYSGIVSKIIPGVVMDNYNEVLEKMADKQEKDPQRSVAILGEEINAGNMPKLYKWAKTNPETLEQQLKSIADKWHNGSIATAMQALESDLEHG